MPFDDMFTDPTAALAIIAASAQLLLQTTLGADYDAAIVSFGAAPQPNNYIHWALTSAGMKFTFAQFRVTMNGDVLPSVVVPWGVLRSVMVPTGPVARVLLRSVIPTGPSPVSPASSRNRALPVDSQMSPAGAGPNRLLGG